MSERLLAPSNVCGTSDCARKCLRHSLENHAPVISTAHSRLNAALYRPDHMQIGFLVTTSPIDAGWSTIWNQSTWTHCLNAKWTVRSRGLLPKSDRYFRWLVTAAFWLAELLAAQRKPPRFLPVHERWRALVSACWDAPLDRPTVHSALTTHASQDPRFRSTSGLTTTYRLSCYASAHADSCCEPVGSKFARLLASNRFRRLGIRGPP
jgi:hypothetical protein